MKRYIFVVLISIFLNSCMKNKESKKLVVDKPKQINKVDKNVSDVEVEDHDIEKGLLLQYQNNFPKLRSGYGVFGSYDVGYNDIKNRSNCRLYYPLEIKHKAPLVIFISGWGIDDPDNYKALLYFIASKGINVVFINYTNSDLNRIPDTIREVLDRYDSRIDRSRVGFVGHSSGASCTFWLVRLFESELGSRARFLYPMASDYTIFYQDYYIQDSKIISYPSNTKMILQMYGDDLTTDIRIGVDLFDNNTIPLQNKEFMFVYGFGHGGCMSKGNIDFDSHMQRSIFRPLDALIDASFNQNSNAIATLKEELKKDPYFHPYIGKDPQHELPKEFIRSKSSYEFSCSQSKVREKYCNELGF